MLSTAKHLTRRAEMLRCAQHDRPEQQPDLSLVPTFIPTLRTNGTITNDKFCLSRHVRLHLSHWRLAQRSQQAMTARLSYPCDRDESRLRHRGGSHEETSMDMPPSASRADGSSAPLGYSLPVPSAMERSST